MIWGAVMEKGVVVEEISGNKATRLKKMPIG